MKYLNLIRKISWSYSRTSGIEFEDLLSEAMLAYAESLNTFDVEKGTLAKHISNKVNWRLKNYIRREQKQANVLTGEVELNWLSTTSVGIPFFELLESLPVDCRVIAEMIVSNPHEYLSVPPKIARGKLSDSLVSDFNWTMSRAAKAIRSIKFELSKC